MLGWLCNLWQPALAKKTRPTLPIGTDSSQLRIGSSIRQSEAVQKALFPRRRHFSDIDKQQKSNTNRLQEQDLISKESDPHQYTAGYWLHRTQLQRQARSIDFNFSALCEKAVAVFPGAGSVVRYDKLEGGFNRAFIMHLDNDKKVVARIPFRVAGPRRLTTHSEVATISYIRSFTKIPVPKVLDWSDDDSNLTGTEYIIMEHVPGVQLAQKWPYMTPLQHLTCVEHLAEMVIEMVRLPFPAFGSLYFANAPIDYASRIEFAEGFCIGPHCGRTYWDRNASEARFYKERPPNQGPWADLEAYSAALIDVGFSRIPKADPTETRLPYRGSVQEHRRLLDHSRAILKALIKTPTIENLASPTLLHPDLHMRNLYVSDDDPTSITAIIDWQSTSIEPLFAYADYIPDYADNPLKDQPAMKKLLNRDDAEETPETREEEAARKRQENDVERCIKIFEVMMLGFVQKFHEARVMGDQPVLRFIRYCDGSWRDSAAALRQEMIELSGRWEELGLPGDCPYQPTEEELAEHAKQYEDFKEAERLRLGIRGLTGCDSDGWVAAEDWEA
ncbi:uncharacterized protein BDZ99DRAFT_567476 [Mytilinidion resinicola]|uniref:Altered inheritance of mitochondria protein 9, mitochondrial n=1 Tax=Mytilinidion resinicola TaxID=574789 RepID=A0A6A6YYV4_9PEZI|nr:uncharacterized protein BDZ99DRAFT_567476 [Mytilinidion resinicola]KAF2813728.1 hypothetical protein BDZ99DRAFT_567476 [Mytilinidion resinicola]